MNTPAQALSRAQQGGRWMQKFILDLSIVVFLISLVGMVLLSLGAAAWAPSASARPSAAATLVPCAAHQAEAEASCQAKTQAGVRALPGARWNRRAQREPSAPSEAQVRVVTGAQAQAQIEEAQAAAEERLHQVEVALEAALQEASTPAKALALGEVAAESQAKAEADVQA